MRTIVFMIIVTVAQMGLGEDSAVLPGGERVTVHKCTLTLKRDGAPSWEKPLPCQDPALDGQIMVHDLGEGRVALHVKYAARNRGEFDEYVLVSENVSEGFRLVWKEQTGLKGDVGERLSLAVRFQDLTGDGIPEIVTGTMSEAVSLCGMDEKPLLFRQVYDWKKAAFRHVLARRPGFPEPVNIQGSNDPGKGQTRALVEQTVPLAVSRAAGDRGDPILLSPPRALVDGDPATAWMPLPENGAGEFATFKTLAPVYGVTRVGIRPLPAVKRPKSYDRPRSLFLSTENGFFRLSFPSDPIQSPEEMIWFELPSPQHSRCFSLIVESSYARSAQRPLALSEVVFITEADGPDGLRKLAEDLNSSQKRRQAALLLERAGPEATDAIRAVWEDLNLEGKHRAVTVVANGSPKAGVDLLCDGALRGGPELMQSALRGIKNAGDVAVPILEKYLVSEEELPPAKAGKGSARAAEEGFGKVVEILAALGTPRALELLASQAGKGGRERRILLRRHLAQMGLARRENADHLFALAEEAKDKGRKEALFDFVRALAQNRRWSSKLRPIVDQLYSAADGFEDRYRALLLVGQLRCFGNRDHLLTSAVDPDHLIRAVAIEALGNCVEGAERARAVAREALGDTAVEVRLAALHTLERLGAEEKSRKVVARLAVEDAWPGVRARSVHFAARFDPGATLPILSVAKNDSSPVVRAAALKGAGSISGKEADRLIEDFLANDEEESGIKIMAAGIAARRCQRTAVPLLFDLLKRGAEPQAGSKEVDVAVAAAESLGRIGGSEAREYLYKAKRRSNLLTDRAIDAALGKSSSRCESR